MTTKTPKHTPGQWEVKDVNPDQWTRQVWTKEGHGSVMIATTGGIDKDANARLIAAAPEMLDAIREAVAGMDAEWGQATTDANFPKLRALLARLDGDA